MWTRIRGEFQTFLGLRSPGGSARGRSVKSLIHWRKQRQNIDVDSLLHDPPPSRSLPPGTTSLSGLIPYEYEALDPGMIRVLFIRWAMKSDDLLCAMYCTRPGGVDYTAISYAWESSGGEDETVAIPLLDVLDVEHDNGMTGLQFVNQPRRQLVVKKSIWKMILAVGMIGDDDGLDGVVADQSKSMATAVWIDQVCINQLDMVEKADQVKMMYSVYEEAQNTIIYLGEPTNQTAVAFEAAHALASLAMLDVDKLPIKEESLLEGWGRPLKHLNWSAIPSTSGHTPKYADFTDRAEDVLRPYRQFAEDLLWRRWWSRTWVLQELACSRAVEIMVGGYRVPWDSTVAACRVASKLGYPERVMLHSTAHEIEQLEELRLQYRAFVDATANNLESREGILNGRKSMISRTIPRILPIVLYKGVTEPSDKIFALLNIASELHFDEIRSRYLSIFDYQLPLRIVYIRACELWHAGSSMSFDLRLPGESARGLSFLDWVLDTTESDRISLPTWVPHWMQNGPMAMVTATDCTAGFTEDKFSPPVHVLFPSPDQFSLDEVPLTVRGIALFTVHRVSGDVSKLGTYSEHAAMLSDFSNPYPTTEMSYLDAYRHAMVPEAHEFGCTGDRTQTFWEYTIQHSAKAYDQRQARETAFTEKELTSALPASLIASVLGPQNYLAVGRSFFTTTNGFIGLAPLAAKPGDQIGLFFGGRSPYVIRKLQSGKYRFVGPCYPLGVMHGEALDHYHKQEVTDFVLV